MQAQIHGWNTPVITTTSQQWLLSQQFIFPFPTKTKMNEQQ
jgi:hypothetical protein